ncbi:MAG: LamG-like jellyroll fold domain-containing protein [Verrucomicrobiota bacterium]
MNPTLALTKLFRMVLAAAQASALLMPSSVAAATAWDALQAGNPVIPGYFADPCSRKFGDTYYLYVTPDGWDVGRGPAGVWTSKDYVNWTWQSMNWPKTDFKWAPSVVQVHEKFYMFSSVPCQIWAASAESPTGPWTNLMGAEGKEMIPDQTPKGSIVLDGEAFIDDDESAYLWYSTWWHPTVAKLKPDMHSFDGEPIQYFKHDALPNPPKGLVTGCMEAPYMFKRKGIYYLMYSDAMCQDSTYNVKYSTSKSPTGPFDYDPAKNPILETTDDDTVDGPGHHSMLVEGERVYITYHRHDNPHDPDGAHRQTCISQLYFNADGSIEKVQPGHAGVGYLAPSTKRDTNLALGKPATASSFLSAEFRPQYAADENNGTLWKAADNHYPQWLQVDLGKTSPVRRVETEFQYPQVANRYLIETSNDAKTWQTFADGKQNTQPGIMLDKGEARARYVRITLLGQDSGRPEQWAALWGFKVYDGVDKPNQAPVVDPGPALNLNFRYPSFNLEGTVHDDGLPNGPVSVAWSKASGPGNVSFTHPDRPRTDVLVDKPGRYILKLTADDGALKGEATLEVNLAAPTERVIAYDFDEKCGAIANDSSDNGKSGVLRKGATRSMGMRDGAVNLDGAAAFIAITPIGELKCATIAAWINPHNVNPDSSLLCTDGGALRLTLNASGAVQLGIEGLPPQASEFHFSPARAGEWCHVAVTYDPAAQSVAFYINGKLDVSRSISAAPRLNLSQPARIGGAESGARGFSGEMDEFRLFEKVLTAGEIASLAKPEKFMSIAAAAKLRDGTPLVLVGKPVTLAAADPLTLERSTDFFYVADLDGKSGIRVEDGKTGQDKCAADVCVSLTGTLKTKPNKERYVELNSPPTKGATRSAPASPAKNRGLASAIGRLVSMQGVVKEASADAAFFTLGDDTGEAPVKVITSHYAPMTKLAAGNTVSIVGIIGFDGDSTQPVVLTRELVRINPPPGDALASYSFEEDGAIAKDSSPNKQDAALAAGASRSVGKQGKCLQLDGEKGFLEVPDLGMQTAVTIALWVNLTDYAKDVYASVLHCDNWTWGDIHWNVAKDTKKVNVHLNGIGEVHSKFEFTPDKLGQWVHLAVTYDAKARSLRLFVNGAEEASAGVQTARAVDLTHVKFGCWNGRERMWKGAMDEVRIYSRALTPAEITALAGSKATGK